MSEKRMQIRTGSLAKKGVCALTRFSARDAHKDPQNSPDRQPLFTTALGHTHVGNRRYSERHDNQTIGLSPRRENEKITTARSPRKIAKETASLRSAAPTPKIQKEAARADATPCRNDEMTR